MPLSDKPDGKGTAIVFGSSAAKEQVEADAELRASLDYAKLPTYVIQAEFGATHTLRYEIKAESEEDARYRWDYDGVCVFEEVDEDEPRIRRVWLKKDQEKPPPPTQPGPTLFSGEAT